MSNVFLPAGEFSFGWVEMKKRCYISKLVFTVLIGLLACQAPSMRDPVFVPTPILSELEENLLSSGLWSLVRFQAPEDEDLLVVVLTVSELSDDGKYMSDCSQAIEIISKNLPGEIEYVIEFIIEWRILYRC